MKTNPKLKYLFNSGISQFNSLLDHYVLGNVVIKGKIEAYSFKSEPVSSENKKFQNTKNSRSIPIRNSGGSNSSISLRRSPVMTPPSPFDVSLGRFGMNQALRIRENVLVNLKLALNNAFPFYEFKDVLAEDFVKETDIQKIITNINSSLHFSVNDRIALWEMIEEIISLKSCECFRYLAFGKEDDPLSSSGKLWSWNYFFVNEHSKKVLVFQANAKNRKKEKEEEELVLLEEEELGEFEDLYSEDEIPEYSTFKNVEFYYSMKRIPSVESVDQRMDEEDLFDDLDFDLSFS